MGAFSLGIFTAYRNPLVILLGVVLNQSLREILMKLQKLAVIALLSLGLAGVSAAAATAQPVDLLDCVQGYVPVVSADGVNGTCEPEVTTFEAPAPVSDCASTVTQGTSDLTCAVAYSSLPADVTDTSGDVTTDSSQISENNVPTLMSRDVKFKSTATGSSDTSSKSNLLAALGVLVAALGALGIGLSNQRAAKK